MTKRILLINEDGTAEVGGVKVRVVPVEPVAWQDIASPHLIYSDEDLDPMWRFMMNPLFAAAAIDLSGLPRVPERKVLNASAADHYGQQRARIDGFNQALDAIGVKG